MKIVVPVQLVPDLVEELAVDEGSARLDPDYLRWILNEFDDHAIEQAVLLKESSGGEVTVLAPDLEGAEDALYTAAAKGADRLIKLCADFESGFNNHALARLYLPVIQALQPDLVLTGVQAHNSLDGAMGAQLAELLGLPYIGYVSGLSIESGKATARKEYPGGILAEMQASLPAVLGIQAAENPPRYVPISKVRQAMKSSQIDEESGDLDLAGGLPPSRLYPPEAASRATMIEGQIDAVVAKLAAILDEHGVL